MIGGGGSGDRHPDVGERAGAVVQLPAGVGAGRAKEGGVPSSNPCNPGTYGWDGALGTNSFVDPVERLSLVVMIQNEPPFTTRNLTWGLRNPLYAALQD